MTVDGHRVFPVDKREAVWEALEGMGLKRLDEPRDLDLEQYQVGYAQHFVVERLHAMGVMARTEEAYEVLRHWGIVAKRPNWQNWGDARAEQHASHYRNVHLIAAMNLMTVSAEDDADGHRSTKLRTVGLDMPIVLENKHFTVLIAPHTP